MYEYILSILSIIIGIFIAYLFHYYGKKAAEKHTETLDLLNEKAEGIRQKLDEIDPTKYDSYVIPSEHKPEELSKPSTSDYDSKATECLELLKDKKWKWRSDVILKRKSGLSQTEFDYFVNNTPEVIKSKKPDIYGNDLFSHISKF